MTSIQSEEKSDLAVVDLTKSVQFHGTGISSDQSDHARWVKGDSCEMNIVPLFSTSSIDLSLLQEEDNTEVEHLRITSKSSHLKNILRSTDSSKYTSLVNVDGTAQFLFAEDSSKQQDERFYLCYKFGNEPYHLYKDIVMQVFDLYDAPSYSTQDKSDDKVCHIFRRILWKQTWCRQL